MENAGCLDGPEPADRDTAVGVAIAEAAALHDEVIDGVVWGRWGRRGPRGRQEAGAALPLQQPHAQVGHLQLRLGFRAVGVLGGEGRREGSIYHLDRKEVSAVWDRPWDTCPCPPRVSRCTQSGPCGVTNLNLAINTLRLTGSPVGGHRAGESSPTSLLPSPLIF